MEVKTETVLLDRARKVYPVKTIGRIYLPAELVGRKVVGVILKNE